MKIKMLIVAMLAVMMMIAAGNVVQAQNIPPAIMAQVTTELNKRGLTEAEVRTRLIQEGIDLENVPTDQLPTYQTRVMAVLDKMEAEKKGQGNATAATHAAAGAVEPAKTTGAVEPTTTKQEAAAEAAQRVVQAQAADDKDVASIYGHSLFIDKSLDVFRTTDGAQAPDTYIMGDGDEIRITIFGASQTDIQQKVSPDGYIQPAGTAKIFLKGLSLAQAREVIRERLQSSYTFRSDQFAVTIVTARTIMVNVFGEAKVTGGFTISALNSAFNALSAAGGPTKIGSVRDIQLIRGKTRKSIDLYTFMNDPAAQFKFDLQNNDIIFVPVIKSLVSIQGAVKRPMQYEMLPGETLTDLIKYAGGLNMNVFPDFVQIQRYVNGEVKLLEWNLSEVLTGKTKVELENGDVVRIKSISKPMDQYVVIEGSVYYPGQYDLTANPSLSKLLENSKPTFEAKTDVLFVERIRPDNTTEILTVPFPGLKGSADFTLQPRDKVTVSNQAAYRDVATIAVSGHVRNPFEKTFALNDRLTVAQAIELAGGLKTSAYPVAYISRRNLFNPSKVEYIRIELENSANTELQPGDNLNIYDNSTFTNVGEVRVYGAVKTPRGFTYDPSLTVRDVLTSAGGFEVGAAFNKVEVFRKILSPTEKVELKTITLEVDSSYNVLSPQGFTFQPFDQIIVRLTPEFSMGRTVQISGQVKYPGTYVLESKRTQLSDVIRMAGGLLKDADLLGSSLYRSFEGRGNISMNVRKAMNHPGDYSCNPILFEGDVININRLENTVTLLENGTRMAQYSTDPDRYQIKNVVFQGRKPANWYIRNFAGGFDKEADRNSVTVTLPNNQMQATKRFLFFKCYPIVEPGSVITLKMKPPKVEKTEPKEKVDWNGIWSSTLSATTSALTLYLLVNQLSTNK